MRKTAFILLLTLLCSCSIQKRHYLSGYYVEWKKSPPPEEAEIKNVSHQSEEKLGAPIIATSPASESKPELHLPQEKPRLPARKDLFKRMENRFGSAFVLPNDTLPVRSHHHKHKKKTNAHAELSLVCFVASVIFLFVGLLLDSAIFTAILWAMIILTLVEGIIALAQIHKDPEQGGKSLALFTISTLLAFLFIFIYLAFTF